jgi:hypothetical protein
VRGTRCRVSSTRNSEAASAAVRVIQLFIRTSRNGGDYSLPKWCRRRLRTVADASTISTEVVMRTIIAIGLLLLIPASASWADEPTFFAHPSRRTPASNQHTSAAENPPRLVESGWFWTGLSLLGGGTAMLVSGAPPNSCVSDGYGRMSCASWRGPGAALAAAGGLTLEIGAYHRHRQSVVTNGRSVAVAIRF